MNYSEDQLNKMAKEDLEQFVKVLTNPHTSVSALTFGIEILAAETKDESIFLEPLKMLLKHVNAIVREGACIAASSFYSENLPPQEIIDRLRRLASNDPSPAVKKMAADSLEDISTNQNII